MRVEGNRIAIRSGNLFFSTYGTTQFKDIYSMSRQLLAGQGESYVINTQELISALRKCQQINPGHTGFGTDPVSGGTALITEGNGSESIIAMNLISGAVPESGKIFAFDPSRMLTTLQPFTKADIIIRADTARTGSSVMNISSSDPSNTHRAAVAQMTWR
jgi:hypothetical protein